MSSLRSSILVIDDDPTVAKIIETHLNDARELGAFSSFHLAHSILEKRKFDVIFLDIELGESENGLNLISEIKKLQPKSSIIVISATQFDTAISDALLAGADDFIPKPIRKSELVARLQAVVAKKQDDLNILKIGSTKFNKKTRLLAGKNGEKTLLPIDANVFEFLWSKIGTVVTRENIYRSIWKNTKVSQNSLDQSLSRIRKALVEVESRIYIDSIKGQGVVLNLRSTSDKNE